jgi:hypothetical protein
MSSLLVVRGLPQLTAGQAYLVERIMVTGADSLFFAGSSLFIIPGSGRSHRRL